MERSDAFMVLQETIDSQIAGRLTGEITLKIRMYEGGIRQCRAQIEKELKLELKK